MRRMDGEGNIHYFHLLLLIDMSLKMREYTTYENGDNC